MPTLFIIHRPNRWAFTQRLADDLRTRLEADVFVDVTGLDEPEVEASSLRHLRQSEAVLVLVTEHTFVADCIHRDDDLVRREIREALTLNRPMVLACVEGVFPPDGLPDDIQAVRGKAGLRFFAGAFQASVERLAQCITQATPIPARAATGIAPPPPTATTGQRTLAEAEELVSSGRYAEAVLLLQEVRESSYRSQAVDLEAFILDTQKRREATLRREQAARVYRALTAAARLVKGPAMEQRFRAAWVQFGQEYPDLVSDLDSRDLTRHFAEMPATPPPVAAVAKVPFSLPLLDWLVIPAGPVTLEQGWRGKAYSTDAARTYSVEPFAISKYPVTYAQFQTFIEDGGYGADRWWQGLAKRCSEPALAAWPAAQHPRERVNWYEAIAFCRWLSSQLGYTVSLPSELQWQRAAQGEDEREYPWGWGFHKTRCNTLESGLKRTTPVDRYPGGASLYGVLDMSGNVWEWCLNESAQPDRSTLSGEAPRGLRGGAWRFGRECARCAYRYYHNPGYRDYYLGFRLVRSALAS